MKIWKKVNTYGYKLVLEDENGNTVEASLWDAIIRIDLNGLKVVDGLKMPSDEDTVDSHKEAITKAMWLAEWIINQCYPDFKVV